MAGSNANGTAMPARTTTFGYGPRCQLPETVTNALGQTSTYQYRYDFGVPTQATDPNGLATAWVYDEYGRRTPADAARGNLDGMVVRLLRHGSVLG